MAPASALCGELGLPSLERAKAMVSFSLLGLQARSLAFNPLDVHGPSHKYIIPCASLPGNSSPIIPFLNFEDLGKIFPVSTSWVLFPVFRFFFFLLLCPRLSPVSADLVRFPKSSHISCRLGFVSCRFAVLLFYPFSTPQVFRPASLLMCCCLFAVYLHDGVSIAIFCFPHRLATVFVCLSVLLVFVQDFFGKTW